MCIRNCKRIFTSTRARAFVRAASAADTPLDCLSNQTLCEMFRKNSALFRNGPNGGYWWAQQQQRQQQQQHASSLAMIYAPFNDRPLRHYIVVVVVASRVYVCTEKHNSQTTTAATAEAPEHRTAPAFRPAYKINALNTRIH